MGDYSEIRGTPADPVFALRMWAKGYREGIALAVSEDLAAAELEVRAWAALEACGAPARTIIDQARDETRLTHPELDPVAQRALAAAKVIAIIRRRLRRMPA